MGFLDWLGEWDVWWDICWEVGCECLERGWFIYLMWSWLKCYVRALKVRLCSIGRNIGQNGMLVLRLICWKDLMKGRGFFDIWAKEAFSKKWLASVFIFFAFLMEIAVFWFIRVQLHILKNQFSAKNPTFSGWHFCN